MCGWIYITLKSNFQTKITDASINRNFYNITFISTLAHQSSKSQKQHNRLHGKLYIILQAQLYYTHGCVYKHWWKESVGQGVQGRPRIQPGEWRLASRRVDPEIPAPWSLARLMHLPLSPKPGSLFLCMFTRFFTRLCVYNRVDVLVVSSA